MRAHEANKHHVGGYTVAEAEGLLTKDEWAELDSMVQIPAGPFIMGTNYERADPQDKPQHTVKMPAYWMDKYLVTNAQYAKIRCRHCTSSTVKLEGWQNSRG